MTIFRSKANGSHLYYQDQAFQSQGDAQGTSYFPYIHAMRAIMVGRNARRVAVLGCAGGALASMMARAGAAVTAVDVDQPASHKAA